jgi:hypothetical protein
MGAPNGRVLVLVSAILSFSIPHASVGAPAPNATPERRQEQALDAAPIWEREVTAFSTVEPPDARPWRKDSRLAGLFHSAEFPDDIDVVFEVKDSRPPLEVMWVTVLAYDPGSDRFLGQLLDAPYAVATAHKGDNVVFRVAAPGAIRIANVPGRDRWCVAEDDGRGFGAQGWPRRMTPFVSAMSQGVRAYRLGNFGHNQPEIERCIAQLRPALSPEPTDAGRRDLQLANFVLARCLSEKYLTAEAVTRFERAIALDPRDSYAQMGLIAELTVLVHSGEPNDALAKRKGQLVEDMARMRADFPNQTQALQLLDMFRDPKQAKPGLSPGEIEEGKQIGFAVIRYKYR